MSMTLEKERVRLIAARDEIDSTIQALDQVLAYLRIKPAKLKGVNLSTNSKPGRPSKKKHRMSPEGEARRLAGLRAYNAKRHAGKNSKRSRRLHKRVPEGFWAKTVREAIAAGAPLNPKSLQQFSGERGTEVTYKAASMALDRYRKGGS